uniref:Amino acid transporter transmembrane domain-containing protein n=1 Tax=Alexandrium monilatum TaxID=311494 RepID=A0A7S4RXL9_9DINO
MQGVKRFSTTSFDEHSPTLRRELLLGNARPDFMQRSCSMPSDLKFVSDRYAAFAGQMAKAANNGKLAKKVTAFLETGALVSTRDTALTLANQIVGAGMLALPYAMLQSGMLFSILLVGVAALMGFTMWLVGYLLELVDDVAESMGVPRANRDWSLIGRLAFGERGRKLFILFCMLDLYGALVSFIVMIGVNLGILFPGVPLPVLISITGVTVFALLFAPEHYFAVFAMVGLLAQVMILSCLVITGVELEASGASGADVRLLNAAGIPAAMGIAIFLFVAHSEAPLLYQMMEDRSSWRKAVILGFIGSLGVFLLVAVLGYVFFGSATQQSFTANLGRDLELHLLPGHFNALFSCACAGLIVVKLTVSQPFTAAPIIAFVEDSVGLRDSPVGAFLWKAIFMAFTTMMCIVAGNSLAPLMELLGCVVQNAICIILPCLATLRLQGGELSARARAALWVIVLTFSAYMLVGLEAILVPH